MSEIKFGTDGWRAVIAEDFTFANVRICAQAVADYLRDLGTHRKGVVVGYDTRFASEHFAAAVARVLAANGITAYLCDRAAPTPVISYSILTHQAAGGIIITASHNPWTNNGFKYKLDYGASATPQVVEALEAHIARIQQAGQPVKELPQEEATRRGLLEWFDPQPRYLERIRSLVDIERIKEAGLRIVVDSMHGAGAGYLPLLLSGGKTQVREIRHERNPYFGGVSPEPIPKNLGDLVEAVRAGQHDVGLATDGDADRLGVLDENGRFVNQLEVFALLALYLLEVRGERGPLVKSITTTSMLYRLGEAFGVPVHETPVGFKFIGSRMREVAALIGGEESGGYAFRGHIPERDGVLAGLYFLDLMIGLNKKPSELVKHLFQKVGPHYYDRTDLSLSEGQRQAAQKHLSQARPQTLNGVPVTQIDAFDGFRYVLQDGTWLLIRFSGTEPIMRIYTETNSPERVQRLLAQGRELAGV